MAIILPATILTSAPFKKIRTLWATDYHNVKVVTIAQYSGHDQARFPSGTNLAECIVIADKGVGENTGRATFVCLNERPQRPVGC